MKQADKSAATRARLLEAAVECLVERGYAGTSTNEVGRRAGESRGAQLHHFPTKAELLGAAVEHVMNRRHDELRARLAGERLALPRLFELLWAIYSGPTLVAWQELVVASRTDAELRACCARVNARFTDAAEATFRAVFGAGPRADVGPPTRILLAALDGLALGHGIEDAGLTRRALDELRRLIEPWTRRWSAARTQVKRRRR